MSKRIEKLMEVQRRNRIVEICRNHGKFVARKFLVQDYGMTKPEAMEKWHEVRGE